jgi:hypothetical protein
MCPGFCLADVKPETYRIEVVRNTGSFGYLLRFRPFPCSALNMGRVLTDVTAKMVETRIIKCEGVSDVQGSLVFHNLIGFSFVCDG